MNHEASILRLRKEVLALQRRHQGCEQEIEALNGLQNHTADLRAQVQVNLDRIRETKYKLDTTQLKLSEISRELQECQFEETRRCIADKLGSVLKLIQDVPKMKNRGSIKQADIDKAARNLTDIRAQTQEVLRIARQRQS